VMSLTEDMLKAVFLEVLGVRLPDFPVLSWDEAMGRYGSDKPDLRNPLELVDIADLVRSVEFKVFNGPANDPGGRVVALRAPGGGRLSRKVIDDYAEFVGRYGAKGLAYIKVNDLAAGTDGLQSPILKFLPYGAIAGVLDRTGAADGDLVFFGADKKTVVNDALGALREKLGSDRGLTGTGWSPLWVVDFPMFLAVGEGGWDAVHHPFPRPKGVTGEDLKASPGAAMSAAYDLCLRGTATEMLGRLAANLPAG